MDVVLRPLTQDDAEALGPLMVDPQTLVWNAISPPVAAWIEHAAAEDERSATFAVTDPEDQRLLGTVSVFSIDHGQGTAEAGYRVLPTERGRGVATAALRALADYGFGEQGLRRIQLFHAVANPASCRVAERAGFGLEGTLRESYVYGDGTAYDEHLHARLATDVLAT